jgi:cytidyltransferase-like protein
MGMAAKQIVVTGRFDDIRSHHLRFLQEAAKLGQVNVLLWDDATVRAFTGKPPRFPLAERKYFIEAVRYVSRGFPMSPVSDDVLPLMAGFRPEIWVDEEGPANDARRAYCHQHGMGYHLLSGEQTRGFPELPAQPSLPDRKKVIVTGGYDWLHSRHVRFFEEVSAFGDVYVIVGHDANFRLLKGKEHPLLPQEERRYMAASIRYVTQALVSSGHGWLDAEPEIHRLRPHIYAVNEDGDQGGKREYCQKLGIEYLVLQRRPAPSLPARSSTNLRGF